MIRRCRSRYWCWRSRSCRSWTCCPSRMYQCWRSRSCLSWKSCFQNRMNQCWRIRSCQIRYWCSRIHSYPSLKSCFQSRTSRCWMNHSYQSRKSCCHLHSYQCWMNHSYPSWKSCCPNRRNRIQCYRFRSYLYCVRMSLEYHRLKNHQSRRRCCCRDPTIRMCRRNHYFLVLRSRRCRMRWCCHCCQSLNCLQCGLRSRRNRNRCYRTVGRLLVEALKSIRDM